MTKEVKVRANVQNATSAIVIIQEMFPVIIILPLETKRRKIKAMKKMEKRTFEGGMKIDYNWKTII